MVEVVFILIAVLWKVRKTLFLKSGVLLLLAVA